MLISRALAAPLGVSRRPRVSPAARPRWKPKSKQADKPLLHRVALTRRPRRSPTSRPSPLRAAGGLQRPRSRCPGCRSRRIRGPSSAGHQLAAVPQGDGHPAEAGLRARRCRSTPRATGHPGADQRARLLPQPVPRQSGRVGEEPQSDGGGVLGDQHSAAGRPRAHGSKGPFDGSTRLGALSNVGYQQARVQPGHDEARRLQSPIIWLDVEPVPEFDWPADTAANAAVVRGAARGYTDAGFASAPTPPRPCGSTSSAACAGDPRVAGRRTDLARRGAAPVRQGPDVPGRRGRPGPVGRGGRDMNITCPGTSARDDRAGSTSTERYGRVPQPSRLP